MARLTGLEPATPGVTGRYSNQLSYNRASTSWVLRAVVARLTGLEPATPGVTGRYSNQLSYNRSLRARTLGREGRIMARAQPRQAPLKPNPTLSRSGLHFPLPIRQRNVFVFVSGRKLKPAMRPIFGAPRLFRRLDPFL